MNFLNMISLERVSTLYHFKYFCPNLADITAKIEFTWHSVIFPRKYNDSGLRFKQTKCRINCILKWQYERIFESYKWSLLGWLVLKFYKELFYHSLRLRLRSFLSLEFSFFEGKYNWKDKCREHSWIGFFRQKFFNIWFSKKRNTIWSIVVSYSHFTECDWVCKDRICTLYRKNYRCYDSGYFTRYAHTLEHYYKHVKNSLNSYQWQWYTKINKSCKYFVQSIIISCEWHSWLLLNKIR